MSELFDEVDERDIPTGNRISKKTAHLEKRIHRCIAIYLYAPDGRLWLQVHKKSSNRLDHSIGGHVSAGEAYLTAARREMHEELGIKDVALKEVFSGFISKERHTIHMFAVYDAVAPSEWSFSPNHEVEMMELVSLSQLVVDMNKRPESYTSGLVNTLKEYLKKKKSPLVLTATIK